MASLVSPSLGAAVLRLTPVTQSRSDCCSSARSRPFTLKLVQIVPFFYERVCARREQLWFRLRCHTTLDEPCKVTTGWGVFFHWVFQTRINFQCLKTHRSVNKERLPLQIELSKAWTLIMRWIFSVDVCFVVCYQQLRNPVCCSRINSAEYTVRSWKRMNHESLNTTHKNHTNILCN